VTAITVITVNVGANALDDRGRNDLGHGKRKKRTQNSTKARRWLFVSRVDSSVKVSSDDHETLRSAKLPSMKIVQARSRVVFVCRFKLKELRSSIGVGKHFH